MKRYLVDNEDQAIKTKKLKKTLDDRQIITYFESLSNDLYYEIFDYFDSCELYDIFSNLNTRFQNLVTSRALRIKIDLDTESTRTFQKRISKIINPKRHQILSIEFIESNMNPSSLSLLTIDSSFSRLESLVVMNIQCNELLRLFLPLITLPRLFSLTIDSDRLSIETTLIYQLIFSLPFLKYTKLAFLPLLPGTSLPIARTFQFSRIEHLVVYHCCLFNELITIIDHTPKLKYLKCNYIKDAYTTVIKKPVKMIPSLTHLRIERCYTTYDELVMSLMKMTPNLQILHMLCAKDVTHLDAHRWEQFLPEYLPHLRVFEFEYEEPIYRNFQITQYHQQIKRFNSSFWIERKWFLTIYIDAAIFNDNFMIYSISPNKKNNIYFHENIGSNASWIDTASQNYVQHDTITNEQKSTTASSTFSQMNQLFITGHWISNNDILPSDRFGPILLTLPITLLNIMRRDIFCGALIDLLRYLPNLDSLVVFSLSMTKPRHLTVDEERNLRLISSTNKIAKVKLYQMTDLAQGQFLLQLCPSIRYFETDCTNGVTPETFIRFILMKNVKYIPHLSTLCLETSSTNENTLNNLKKMIDMEHLCQEYTITQKDTRIYLQWIK